MIGSGSRLRPGRPSSSRAPGSSLGTGVNACLAVSPATVVAGWVIQVQTETMAPTIANAMIALIPLIKK